MIQCIKCGNVGTIKIKYTHNGTEYTTITKEWLECLCERCSYAWEEPTIDQKQVFVSSRECTLDELRTKYGF